MRGDLGRIHISVGVAIESPGMVLRARPAREMEAKGPRAGRITEYAERIRNEAGLDGGAGFELVEDIPEHMGFGSGTQLALAVGTALSKMYDLQLTEEEIASRLNRSRISGIGTYAFKHGGFIVDGGHRVDSPDSVPPLVFRSDVPRGWSFVVGLPEIMRGISGGREKEAFRRLEPPSKELVGEVSRVVLVKMIPAILDKDIEAFGEAMTALDYGFGEYWIEVQGGRFSHPVIEEGVGFLLGEGAYGAGQSSWGPAFYGLADGENHARELSDKLGDFLNSGGRRGKAFFTEPNNSGARVTVGDG